MSFIAWILVGALVGWLASIIMKTNQSQGALLNIVVGIVGAIVGGWLISPVLGIPTINQSISLGSIAVSLGGAVLLLALVRLLRGGTNK